MLPASLEQVILRGLEKDPDARYGSASDFAAALRDVKQEIQEQAGSAGRKTKTAARQVLPELAESDQETQTMTVGACPPKLSSALASQPQASEPEQVRERPADLEGPNECEALLLNRSHGTTQGGSIMPDAPVDNSDTGAKKEGDQETQLASALDADLPIRNKLSKSGGR
jgi:hypothetical protein